MFDCVDRNNDGVGTLDNNTHMSTQLRVLLFVFRSCTENTLNIACYHCFYHFLLPIVGRIDVGEIQYLLHKLGVEVTMEQASRILQR